MAYSFCHVSYQKGSVGYTATIKQIKNNLIPSWTLIDMIAAVFHKIADVNVDNVPHPRIEHPEDIVLKVTTTAICSSDLHIYDGFVPQLRGEELGHEYMGIVEKVGQKVTRVKKGDRVVVLFTIACVRCFYCRC
jgi:S-(hydroxymethyl)glutathione dehydrogenase / alcohol dehydrogenase